MRAAAAQAKSRAEIEAERHALLRRAGFASLTEVDRTKGYDRVLLELGTLRENLGEVAGHLAGPAVALPAGSGGALQADSAAQRKRMLYVIGEHLSALGGDAYLGALRERFRLVPGVRGIEDLPTAELHQVLMTLAARRHTKTARGVEGSLAAEDGFADDVVFPPEDGEAEWLADSPAETVAEAELAGCGHPF